MNPSDHVTEALNIALLLLEKSQRAAKAAGFVPGVVFGEAAEARIREAIGHLEGRRWDRPRDRQAA